MRPARVGVQLHPQHAEYADLRRACAELDALGVDEHRADEVGTKVDLAVAFHRQQAKGQLLLPK